MDPCLLKLARSTVAFIAILNPFALSLYLASLMDDLERRQFFSVLFQASLISLVVFVLFAWCGEPLLVDFLAVQPAALRVFGGLIFVVVAYNYVTQGYKATVFLRGDLDGLPSSIALPFMIGAGTITQAILTGKRHELLPAVLIITCTLVVCFVIVAAFKIVRDHMSGPRERVFLRYVNILARLNGLIIGAISIDMIAEGLKLLWTRPLDG
ncbi:MAG: MarC family protein [Pirellulales bacterium]|nr:MarC family protein [Pirellulales bacterium]